MTPGTVHVALYRGVAPDAAALTDAERGALVMGAGPRRDEWIAGRIAVRRALREVFGARADGASVLVAPDGAPLLVGAPRCGVSLSHDGPWVAVAIAGGGRRVGVDLCVRDHAERIARILGRLGARTAGVEPCAAWAALEATLKLRRLPILALREHAVAVDRRAMRLEVRGLGATVPVELRDEPDFVVAWTAEAVA